MLLAASIRLPNTVSSLIDSLIVHIIYFQLNIEQGTIKACVLIENILASFEMEEILYELRHHSLGLNCGMWDYSASFVNKFGTYSYISVMALVRNINSIYM